MQVNGRIGRRRFLGRCAAGVSGMALGTPLIGGVNPPAGGNRPNILWIIAEDLYPDLSCYSTPLVRTPNIDRLAADGIRFTNAFTTAPVCSASRSALMTGMYQTSIAAHQHRTTPLSPLPGDVGLITDYFRAAGYFTSNCAGLNWERPGKTDFNFRVDRAFDGTDWRQRGADQPFFAQVNFSETHRAFKKDRSNPINPESVVVPPYYPDHRVTRQDWADYLECAQVLDQKVGAVLKRLREDNLTENTIVFFFGDHGRPHVRGKQFLYEGGIHIPLIICWPGRMEQGSVVEDLVSAIDLGPTCMSLAGIKPPGHLQGEIFLGRDRSSRKYIYSARDRCDETFDRIRCVRDKRFKYIRNFYPNLPYTQTNLYKLRQYPVLTLMQVLHAEGKLTPEQARFMAPARPEEELYDLVTDPHELRNLAGEKEFEIIVSRMREALNSWISGTGDLGEEPEDPRIAAQVYVERHMPNHTRVMLNRGLTPDISPAEYLKWWEGQLVATEPPW